MKNISIKASLIIIIALATIFLIFNTVQDFIQWQKIRNVKTILHVYVDLSKSLSALIHETQKERGASAGYLGSKGHKFRTILPKQRLLTDEKIKEYKKMLASINKALIDKNIEKDIERLNVFLDELSSIRKKVTNLQISVKDEVAWYTKMNDTILKIIGDTSKAAPNAKIAMDLASYVSFLKAKERAGIERAVLSSVFAADKFLPGMYTKFITLVAQQKAFIDDFLTFAADDVKKAFFEIIKDPSFTEVEKLRHIAMSKHKEGLSLIHI
jgi:methyl-accepting chemotaxis protein